VTSGQVAANLERRSGGGGRQWEWTETTMQRNEKELRDQLANLRAEHRTLDDEIIELEGSGSADQLLVKRLKKKKLALKDQITIIEDKLLPDIIA